MWIVPFPHRLGQALLEQVRGGDRRSRIAARRARRRPCRPRRGGPVAGLGQQIAHLTQAGRDLAGSRPGGADPRRCARRRCIEVQQALAGHLRAYERRVAPGSCSPRSAARRTRPRRGTGPQVLDRGAHQLTSSPEPMSTKLDIHGTGSGVSVTVGKRVNCSERFSMGVARARISFSRSQANGWRRTSLARSTHSRRWPHGSCPRGRAGGRCAVPGWSSNSIRPEQPAEGGVVLDDDGRALNPRRRRYKLIFVARRNASALRRALPASPAALEAAQVRSEAPQSRLTSSATLSSQPVITGHRSDRATSSIRRPMEKSMTSLSSSCIRSRSWTRYLVQLRHHLSSSAARPRGRPAPARSWSDRAAAGTPGRHRPPVDERDPHHAAGVTSRSSPRERANVRTSASSASRSCSSGSTIALRRC